jgi:formamidopyrimidine-DNA glycosylase
MPELPEVETVAEGLRQRILGRRIASLEIRHTGIIHGSPEEFVEAIEGRSFARVLRTGKSIFIELTAENSGAPHYMLLRLGMTGQVTVAARNEPIEKHTHVVFLLDEGREELRFRDPRRFGKLRSLNRDEFEKLNATLGPDAQRITEAQFLAAMKGRTGAIKSWLMNQSLMAGLGNIYADEALFEARIHPLAQPGRISAVKAHALFRAIRKVLDHAVSLRGTSFSDYLDVEGRPGAFLSKLKVYQHTGEPCRRCKQPIRRLVIGGRSSHFCPRCQTRPRYAFVRNAKKR